MIELGPFGLDAPLGRGGMGEVWSAVHLQQGKAVCVKFLTVKAAHNPTFLAAFRNEVRAAAALDHPHIVMVYDYGETTEEAERQSDGVVTAGIPWLAMELVDGGTLHALLGRFDWSSLSYVVLSLLDALAHAHARGVIHRDLKPGNVLVKAGADGSPIVKLTDFGLAHAVEGNLQSEERPFLGGTPSYMAPEQFGGHWRDYGPWTDLYGFGCLVYTLVRGTPPFGTTTSYAEKQRQHSFEQVPPLHPSFPVPAGFEGWLRRLLEKDPAARFRRAADAAWAFLELGPPDHVDPFVPPEQAGVEVIDTLILGSLVTLARGGPVGDATTISMGAEPAGDVSMTLASELAAAPPLPGDWRRDDRRPTTRLMGAGLGLFGLRTLPLVNREPERDALWAALGRVREQSTTQVAVLTGAAGMGKSHVAEWLCERAHEVGSAVILRAVHAPLPGPGHGLGPMISNFLRCQGLDRFDVLARVENIFRAHGHDHADEWHALTEIIQPATEPTRGAIRFGSLLERHITIRRLLKIVCVERPVVLWLDDVQWGTEALGFVRYLLDNQRLHPLPVLVVLTASTEALEEREAEANQLAVLLQRPEVVAVEIGKLQPEPLAELTEDLLGLEKELAERVAHRSDGNPMFAVQLVSDWVQRGVLVAGQGGFRLRDGVELTMPENVKALWADRVERVLALRSEAEANALELASALGSEVAPAEWLAACAQAGHRYEDRAAYQADPSQALLDAMLDLRLARAGEGGPGRGWSFSHAMLREALEERARRAGRLVAHHQVCAEILAQQVELFERPPPALAERLGRHLLLGRRPADAIEPFTLAAEDWNDASAYGRVEQVLDLRDEAIHEIELPTSDPRHGVGWLLRADLAGATGDYALREALLTRTERAAERHGWRMIGAKAKLLRGKLARLRADRRGALTVLRRAERDAERLGATELLAHARWEIGSVLTLHGELEEAEEVIRRALQGYDALGHRVGCSRCWLGLGKVAKEAGRHREAAELLQKAEELFEECGNRWGMASSVNSQGDVARYQGDLVEAEVLYRRARGLLRAIGSASWIFPDYNLGLVALARGEPHEAMPFLERGLEQFIRQANGAATCNAHLGLAACAAAMGQWILWDEHLREAREVASLSTAVEEDIARVAGLAAQNAETAGDRRRAADAWNLAAAQWRGLRRLAERDAVEGRIRELGFEVDIPFESDITSPRG